MPRVQGSRPDRDMWFFAKIENSCGLRVVLHIETLETGQFLQNNDDIVELSLYEA